MRPELQQQVLALFEQVVDLPAAERQRALESARAESPEACAQVESLLGHDVTADEADFLLNAAEGQGAPPSDSMAGRPDLQAGTDREAHSTDVEKTANLQTAGAGLLDAMPERFGRYRMVRLLDQGAFASVYLGQDEDLDRPVAVKLALADRFRSEADVTRYLDEARKAARLRHPGIVSIYDAGRLDDGRCYVVMEYISGGSLAGLLKAQRLPHARAVELTVEIAEALHEAHQRGLVHRDIKPANVLLDADGKSRVADFGLAVHEDEQSRLTGEIAGTPAYMAPEQMRGEGHRLDGRTDLWGLGVLLYEMLSGRRPFVSGTLAELREEIQLREAPPLNVAEDAVPQELERICLKCLAKRMADRYSTAAELVADLRFWLQHRGHIAHAASFSASAVPRIVPKGLRAFDAHDADFFLSLLPGPRDRNGLPESIRFWKSHLEETDALQTFAVGLASGPSGCGKSSLFKAGLLPRLSGNVIAIYLEATPDGAEADLLNCLRRNVPAAVSGEPRAGIVDAIAALRAGRGLSSRQKVVIVIDQFEQWLQVARDVAPSDLAQALRQCDGGRVQCVLLVRDDFGMAAARFLQSLETPLVHGRNFATVDLFDVRHARKILAEFGRAYGCLNDHHESAERPDMTPGDAGAHRWSRDHEQFLDQAVASLAEGGQVVPVRLAIFAEMVKSRPWTPATLAEVGGTEGVGVTFLEEAFSAKGAHPTCRRHQGAARRVLHLLLPDSGVDLKGRRRSRTELLAASGYTNQPDDFAEFLRALDVDLRLITPVEEGERGSGTDDTDRVADESAAHDAGGSGPEANPTFKCEHDEHFQLTHDFLVPSLRDWLTRKQRETRSGRAELRLSERSAAWNVKSEVRHLPATWEFLNIQCFARKKNWSATERRMMRIAARRHAWRWSAALAGVVLAALAIWQFARGMGRKADSDRATALVEAVLGAAPDALPAAIENVRPFRPLAVPLLRARFADTTADDSGRLHCAFALAALGEPPGEFLLERIGTVPKNECLNIVRAIQAGGNDLIARLNAAYENEADLDLRIRLATTLLYLGDPRAAAQSLSLGPNPTSRTKFIHGFQSWSGDLSSLPDCLRRTEDSAFRSGICTALGTLPPDKLSATERAGLQDMLLKFFVQAPDGATHSAAAWALRRWSADLPPIEASAAPRSGWTWYVNKNGMTMSKIPAGSFTMGTTNPSDFDSHPPHRAAVTRPYYMSDQEVSVEQFQRFMDDPSYVSTEKPLGWPGPHRGRSPTGDCPVQQVSWFDCILYCNWLSAKENRRPCYRRTSAMQVIENYDTGRDEDWNVWDCDFQADGYRLPTEAEWENAARALTTTHYYFGDEPDLLPHYAYFVVNAKQRAWPTGSKMPNAWGLFDVHGNAFEWCWDAFERFSPVDATDPTGPGSAGADRVIRGGGWFFHDASSAHRAPNRTTKRHDHYGFRPVRALEDSLKNGDADDPRNRLESSQPAPLGNLLDTVDPATDTLSGTWRREADGLHSGQGDWSRIAVPIRPTGDYHVQVKFARLAGSNAVSLILPVGPAEALLTLDGWPDRGGRSGLQAIDGKTAEDVENPSVVSGQLLVNGRQHTLDADVSFPDRNDVCIVVALDGKKLFEWSGAIDRLSVDPECSVGDGRLGLGAWYDPIRFESVALDIAAIKPPPKPMGTGGPSPGESVFSAERTRPTDPVDWLDLLNAVDPEMDAICGIWRRGATGLLSPKREAARISIPVFPAGDYRLQVRFARLEGNEAVDIILPVGSTQTLFILDGWPHLGGRTGLEPINGVSAGNLSNPSAVGGQRIVNNRSHLLDLYVAADGDRATIEVDLDGEALIRWTGATSELWMRPQSAVGDRKFGLESWESVVRFEAVRLRMLSGSAQFLRP